MKSLPLIIVVAGLGLLGAGCNDDPTTVSVENGFAIAATDGGVAGTMTVYKAWWVTTLFRAPVVPGQTSETERTIPGSDYAYALLAPDWSPDLAAPPARLIALKSTDKLTATEHDLLTISISNVSFAGNCAAGSALSADDAQLVTERIFPGDFTGLAYDADTCVATRAGTGAPGDASAD